VDSRLGPNCSTAPPFGRLSHRSWRDGPEGARAAGVKRSQRGLAWGVNATERRARLGVQPRAAERRSAASSARRTEEWRDRAGSRHEARARSSTLQALAPCGRAPWGTRSRGYEWSKQRCRSEPRAVQHAWSRHLYARVDHALGIPHSFSTGPRVFVGTAVPAVPESKREPCPIGVGWPLQGTPRAMGPRRSETSSRGRTYSRVNMRTRSWRGRR